MSRKKVVEIPKQGRDSMLQDELDEHAIGYKAVRMLNSKAFIPATSNALQSFRYRVNQETRRYACESGPIAIFDSFENAREFWHGTHILKVEYVQSKEKCLWKKCSPSFVHSHGGYYAQSNGKTRKTDRFPLGTLFAESVYVLEVM